MGTLDPEGDKQNVLLGPRAISGSYIVTLFRGQDNTHWTTERMLSSLWVPFQGGQTHTWASHTTHLSPLSLFLFISRVIHVVLIFKSITLAVHLASTMAQSADCQKLEIQNKIPLSLKETSKQRDVRRLTSNSPNKGNLFILRTASLAQPQGRDGKYPFTVHSP